MASINFTIPIADRDAICLRCALGDCVGADSRECPIQVEQRRIWRENYQERKSSGYFAARDQKIKAAKAERREAINA